ncbi:MAG: chromate transporter [Oscillospiraceae bacterium]|jgi:chromate transporter|nr:chromate transporter [Oscillospiraceae bacterium]
MLSDFLFTVTSFFKAGLFAIGGGLATIPYIREYFNAVGLSGFDGTLGVSQALPGPVGVNVASYTGYMSGGGVVWGVIFAITAAVSVIIAPVIVIMAVSGFMSAFRENVYVTSAVNYLRPASAGLVAAAFAPILFSAAFGNITRFDIRHLVLYAVCVVVFAKFRNLPIIVPVLVGGAIGMLF